MNQPLLWGTALWLGILTSISPCPLASNVAAVSVVGQRIGRRGWVLAAGAAYTLGRTLTYAVVGFLSVRAIANVPLLSNFLQLWMNRLLGPLLVVVGAFLLGWVRTGLPGISVSGRTARSLDRFGLLGVFLLGSLFALAFCPLSAALFFGSLVPLAVEAKSDIVMPALYGIGTGLPVAVFGILVAVAVERVNDAWLGVRRIESVARRVTGAILILIGGWYSVRVLGWL